ncbi:hypothetical protein M3201_25635 [Paenibacillus motobuensis]|jgi:hypothetical protein|uniref:Uncharacterized protein n=3 Tax=Paenibacillus TaxID=44249 RepID=A0A3Q9IBV2_9BACL|nr:MULTISPECIES: hypothetical protein [Paenibacillus]AZS17364.1 hypothetical protein EI981_25055 [Paenibacillus lutimineralis]MCM3043045.1 hypothetical protein [Paenibacillus lutimineralis]MCM3650149.1 hypothetical protein [Paenibacillus motobuensis]NWL90021.1 hypothetical protein [Paenibacillus sp. 79R4]WMT40511.1 hypothetical protein RE628_25595 [Paenibacillus sp. D2_2]
MLGMMFNDKECKELDYVLRKELDEMLLDMSDQRLDQDIRDAIAKRYKTVFRMYARFAPSKELSKYARNSRFPRVKQ